MINIEETNIIDTKIKQKGERTDPYLCGSGKNIKSAAADNEYI